MTTALEIGAAFLLTATLLAAAMVLAAFQLGRLVTRDDEQRDVEAASANWMSGPGGAAARLGMKRTASSHCLRRDDTGTRRRVVLPRLRGPA